MILWIVSLLTLLQGSIGLKQFECKGGDICNRYQSEQYCDSIYNLCVDCDKDSCTNCLYAKNCTHFCQTNRNKEVNETVEALIKEAKASSCGALPPILHGYLSTDNTAHGSVVEVRCDKTYTRIGPSTLTCGDYGVWSSNLPVCQVVTCGPPPRLQHGDWNVSTQTQTGAVATFTCHDGFMLEGSPAVVCTEGSTWEPVDKMFGTTLPACYTPVSTCSVMLIPVVFLGVLVVILIVIVIVAFGPLKRRWSSNAPPLTPSRSDASVSTVDIKNLRNPGPHKNEPSFAPSDVTKDTTTESAHRPPSATTERQNSESDQSEETTLKSPQQATPDFKERANNSASGTTVKGPFPTAPSTKGVEESSPYASGTTSQDHSPRSLTCAKISPAIFTHERTVDTDYDHDNNDCGESTCFL